MRDARDQGERPEETARHGGSTSTRRGAKGWEDGDSIGRDGYGVRGWLRRLAGCASGFGGDLARTTPRSAALHTGLKLDHPDGFRCARLTSACWLGATARTTPAMKSFTADGLNSDRACPPAGTTMSGRPCETGSTPSAAPWMWNTRTRLTARLGRQRTTEHIAHRTNAASGRDNLWSRRIVPPARNGRPRLAPKAASTRSVPGPSRATGRIRRHRQRRPAGERILPIRMHASAGRCWASSSATTPPKDAPPTMHGLPGSTNGAMRVAYARSDSPDNGAIQG